ncbi:MAG: peptide deformylase [Clostridia bacterium]|nr:peptide deformylase [Clostridia bacterium]
MARLTIIKQDNPLIRKTSKIVDDFSPRLHELLDNMYETLLHANGMGLAAIQVGVLYRLAIILTEEYGLIEIINPIIKTVKNQRIDSEGCLSCPGISGRVRRPHLVTLEYQDRHGQKQIKTFHGMDAVCCCHEIDHMDGILFIDKLIK